MRFTNLVTATAADGTAVQIRKHRNANDAESRGGWYYVAVDGTPAANSINDWASACMAFVESLVTHEHA